jgi:hypothetical protein
VKTDAIPTAAAGPEAAVKTVLYRKLGGEGASGRVSLRTLREMIARWEIGPDDLIRLEGEPGESGERRVRDDPTIAPLDEMLQSAARRLVALRWGKDGAPVRRAEVIRELEMLREYAERSDRVGSVASFYLGWLRFAESPALARGLFLKAIEKGYPATSVARNNLAVAQIRLGDPAGRDNLILAANDPHRTPASLHNLARLLEHLEALGENVDEIASVKDLLRVARAEWKKSPPEPGEPDSFALFLTTGDIPDSFGSSSRALARLQGQVEDILAEGETCLRQGRLEQALAHAARAAAEMDAARDDLGKSAPQKGISPLRFLSVRLTRLEKEAAQAREARDRQGQLDTFRSRLAALEGSLRLKVPPSDLIQQAEILLDSARSEGEKAEARKLLQDCNGRVARHLLDTASELLASGEKDVATGLLRRALALESDLADEIRLRLGTIRRDELEKEIVHALHAGSFEEARIRIARLRSIHPIFEPVARRLERQADASEAGALLDRVVACISERGDTREAAAEALRLLAAARVLQPEAAALKPVEEHVVRLAARWGLPLPAAPSSQNPNV